METLTFTVQLHQPFLISSGLSGEGLDAVARADTYLPASSLKGVMRAAATHVLQAPADLVGEVFGVGGVITRPNRGSAWAWTNAGPRSAFHAFTRSRNRLDPGGGVTVAEAMATTEEIWQKPGTEITFLVEQLRALDAPTRRRHTTLLRASAYGVTAVGGWRNRGMGTVTIRPAPPSRDLAADLRKALG